ncbi:hypothetical protein D3C71_1194420 [compost metagenome]
MHVTCFYFSLIAGVIVKRPFTIFKPEVARIERSRVLTTITDVDRTVTITRQTTNSSTENGFNVTFFTNVTSEFNIVVKTPVSEFTGSNTRNTFRYSSKEFRELSYLHTSTITLVTCSRPLSRYTTTIEVVEPELHVTQPSTGNTVPSSVSKDTVTNNSITYLPQCQTVHVRFFELSTSDVYTTRLYGTSSVRTNLDQCVMSIRVTTSTWSDARTSCWISLFCTVTIKRTFT